MYIITLHIVSAYYVAVFPLCVYICMSMRHLCSLCFYTGVPAPCAVFLGSCMFLCPIVLHPSSMHYNMSVIIAISMQEKSLYITLKMNGSKLLLFMIMWKW